MIGEALIDEVVSAIGASGVSEAGVAALRQQFAELHLTYCADDDVCGVEPVREGHGFNLYLVHASDHCPHLTSDPQHASGLVLAEVLQGDA